MPQPSYHAIEWHSPQTCRPERCGASAPASTGTPSCGRPARWPLAARGERAGGQGYRRSTKPAQAPVDPARTRRAPTASRLPAELFPRRVQEAGAAMGSAIQWIVTRQTGCGLKPFFASTHEPLGGPLNSLPFGLAQGRPLGAGARASPVPPVAPLPPLGGPSPTSDRPASPRPLRALPRGCSVDLL